MLLYQKDNALDVKKTDDMTAEQLEGKFVTGVFVDKNIPDYTENYSIVKQKAKL